MLASTGLPLDTALCASNKVASNESVVTLVATNYYGYSFSIEFMLVNNYVP